MPVLLEEARTLGNNTYIPIRYAYVSKGVDKLLEALNIFESAHPELEVSSFTFEPIDAAGYSRGIWVRHRPKG